MTIPKSTFFKGLEWTGPRIGYPEAEIKGDTYPCTWTADGEIYASSGDPLWGESIHGLDTEIFSGMPPDFKITKHRHMNDYLGWGGSGPKPTGMASVGGTLYLAFQNLRGRTTPPHSAASQPGADAHIVYYNLVPPSQGAWVPTLANIDAPMFPGYKFGGPAFVQHGRDNENARDEYVYAISSDQWDNGSNLRLGRVPVDRIVEPAKWEWVKAFGADDYAPAWTSNLDDAIPVLSMHRSLGCPEMVYLASCDRYLLLSWRLKADFDPAAGTDLLVFDAPAPWGPFTLVHYEELWEGREFTPYCPRVPLKWFDQDKLEGWLLFSGNWKDGVDKGYYRANVRPFRLMK